MLLTKMRANIEDYFEHFEKEQAALKKKEDEDYYNRVTKNKGKITKL